MKLPVYFFSAVFILFSVLFIYSGCKDSIANVDKTTLPDSNLSYANHIAIIIEAKCSGTDCHSSSAADRPNLMSYSNLTSGYLYVVPYSPETSPLVWAIEHKSGVIAMPPLYSGRALTADQIKGIKTWIKEGAKNN